MLKDKTAALTMLLDPDESTASTTENWEDERTTPLPLLLSFCGTHKRGAEAWSSKGWERRSD